MKINSETLEKIKNFHFKKTLSLRSFLTIKQEKNVDRISVWGG